MKMNAMRFYSTKQAYRIAHYACYDAENLWYKNMRRKYQNESQKKKKTKRKEKNALLKYL